MTGRLEASTVPTSTTSTTPGNLRSLLHALAEPVRVSLPIERSAIDRLTAGRSFGEPVVTTWAALIRAVAAP